jgi:glucose/arabinose dehydrogenase
MAVAPDGRVFVCEQQGRLRVVKDDALLAAPFVTLAVDSYWERGLLGVALDPDFATNRHLYVNWTVPNPPRQRISRFTASGDVAAAGSEATIFEMDPQSVTGQSTPGGHIGGAIHFGIDGKLYIATGDLTAGSPAQSLTNLFGKILRINKDGTIPSDNPFYATASGKNRSIWAIGLRNPFTFAVQPGTGRIYINDVGSSQYEEVNEGKRGANYGWPNTEGPTTNAAYTGPVHSYNHSSGCSVNGGAFYDPPRSPTGYSVLLFTKTAGFRHSSIPAGITAIRELGQQNGFTVDATEDASAFTTANLARYRAVAFLSTSDDVLNSTQEASFQSYLRSGGGFAAIHQGVTTEQTWSWFVSMVGGVKFASHPAVQQATCIVENPGHLSTSGLPNPWTRSDEWYNFDRNPRASTHVLVRVDESTYSGGTMGADHPISWFHGFEGARVWCTAMGHDTAHFSDANFRKHLLGGIQYAAAATPGVAAAAKPFPADYLGKYLFADFCGGWIKRFDPATGAVASFATGIPSPVDVKVAPDGSVYYLARNTGVTGGNGSATGLVYKIEYTASQAPSISSQPQSLTVSAGQPANFTVGASGTAPLAYQWQRNGTPIAGATASTYTLAAAQLSDSGARFRCVVTNSFGSATSSEATLTVTSNQPPVATVTSPPSGATYRAGDSVSYAGTGTDPEDGALPAAAFTWRVDFHHDQHVHPFIPDTTGSTSGSFAVPTGGETAANVWYRIHLTVRDSAGTTHSAYRDVTPLTATVTLETDPPGLQVTLDGQPRTAPHTFTGVVGMVRTLGVVSPQASGGTTYEFAGWSDGGAATHTISTPPAGATYRATFREAATAIPAGLTGEYYDNPDFTSLALVRTDGTVDFSWGSGSPDASVAPDSFSVRWSGRVTPLYSQTYTFYTTSDDGVRLRINGQSIIDNWTDHGPTENSGTIALAAGQPADLVLEYYENSGGATISLSWSSASQPKGVIPAAQLSILDGDSDGMADAAELAAGLDPANPDQDANGTADGWDDWNGNGIPNLTEAAGGAHPGAPPGSGGAGGGGGGGCGATGLEILLLSLLALRRKPRP